MLSVGFWVLGFGFWVLGFGLLGVGCRVLRAACHSAYRLVLREWEAGSGLIVFSGSHSRLMDLYHSTLGLRVIKKKRKKIAFPTSWWCLTRAERSAFSV